MNEATRVVFDDVVENTDPATSTHLVTVYTSLEHSDFLASATQLVFQATVDVLSIRNDVPLSVSIEHSADGQNWQSKNAAPEMSGTVPYTGGTIGFTGGERWPVLPSQRFARLCLNAGGSVGAFAFNVTIHSVTRSRVTRVRTGPAHPELRGDATIFGVPREVVTEIESVLHAARGLRPEDRHELALRRLSPHAHAELLAFQRRLVSMPVRSKQGLLRVAAATIRILTDSLQSSERRPQEVHVAPCDDCPPLSYSLGDKTGCESCSVDKDGSPQERS